MYMSEQSGTNLSRRREGEAGRVSEGKVWGGFYTDTGTPRWPIMDLEYSCSKSTPEVPGGLVTHSGQKVVCLGQQITSRL